MTDAALTDAALTNGTHWWVPHNRWDLVADRVSLDPPTTCAVIVPYFEQPDSLRRMYAALTVAGLDPARYELIVVDDGSTEPPPPPPADFGLPVSVLRQDDLGCRPGAARHLGACHTTAECLVFLDADTLPSPTTVVRLAGWCHAMPDALVVGARHHVVLDGWTGEQTARWLDGSSPAPERRGDPTWLTDAYVANHHLLEADDRSYRFVISGVMACSRELYEDAGGFDVERNEYGSEDWDLAARCFNAGAVMIHDPDAVAWHDEPDWIDRSADDAERETASKNEQWTWLADRIGDPAARGGAVVHGSHGLVCRLAFDSEHRGDAVGEIAAIESLLAAEPDMAVYLPEDAAESTRRYVCHDPRVQIGTTPSADALRRARAVIDLAVPIEWTAGSLGQLTASVAPGGVGTLRIRDAGREIVTVSSTRALHRVRRAATHGIDADLAMRTLFGADTVDNDGRLCLLATRAELAPMFDRPRSQVR